MCDCTCMKKTDIIMIVPVICTKEIVLNLLNLKKVLMVFLKIVVTTFLIFLLTCLLSLSTIISIERVDVRRNDGHKISHIFI